MHRARCVPFQCSESLNTGCRDVRLARRDAMIWRHFLGEFMPQILATVDWFLNAPPDYQAEEPTRRAQLLALVERELDACQMDAERLR